MTDHTNPSPLSDVCLLLRAHAEQSWLSHEVVPVLRQLKQRESLPQEQLGAALAYLEVLWVEASQRAAETEAAHADLQAINTAGDRALYREARGYHAAVCTLRDSVARHVTQLLAVPADAPVHDHANSARDRVRFRECRRASTFNPTPSTPTAPWRQHR
jgi:hypothetical protein